MISIVVPVYNAEKYLQRCIESVTSQTVADLELILVNDGSRDSSLDICRRYAAADPRITVIDKPNGGVSSARNVGIDHVKGEYVSFLDADDYYSPDFLEAFGTDRVRADFFSQGCISEYPDRPSELNSHDRDGLLELSEFMETMLTSNMINTPWGKLYSVKIIRDNNLRFNERLSYAEDRYFNVFFLNCCTTFCVTTACGYHYTHDNPGALTLKRHPAERIMEYVTGYRPKLLSLTSQCHLSPHASSLAGFSYNYHLIQAVIQTLEDKIPRADKITFIRAIPAELVADVNRQADFPTIYRAVAAILRLPTPMAVTLGSFLLKLKKN